MTETAPIPVLRLSYQPALHRIAMQIPQLLYKFPLAPDIEIVVTLLPERLVGPQGKAPGHALLQ
jgi:hypothetical protein